MGQGVGLQCFKSPLLHRLITSVLNCLINHSRQAAKKGVRVKKGLVEQVTHGKEKGKGPCPICKSIP